MAKKSVRKVKQPSPQIAPDSSSNDSSIFSVLTQPLGRAPRSIRIMTAVFLGLCLIVFKVWESFPPETRKAALLAIKSKVYPAQNDSQQANKKPDVTPIPVNTTEEKKPNFSIADSNKSDNKPPLFAYNGTLSKRLPLVKQPPNQTQDNSSTTVHNDGTEDEDDEPSDFPDYSPQVPVNKPPVITKPAASAAVSKVNCADFKGARVGKDALPKGCEAL